MREIEQNSIRNKKVCHLKDDSKTSTRAVRQKTHLLSELCSTCSSACRRLMPSFSIFLGSVVSILVLTFAAYFLYPNLFISLTYYVSSGLVLSMQIPFVGFQPIRTSEHMAAAGVFGLLQVYGAVVFLTSRLTKSEAK